MKQRLISAAFAAPVILAVLLLYNTVVLNIVVALLSVLALYEVFVATGYIKSKGIAAAGFIYAAALPFFFVSHLHLVVLGCSYLFVVVLFALLMHYRTGLSLSQVGTGFFLTILISTAFSSIVFLRDLFIEHAERAHTPFDALFYIVLIFIGAWITDAGAYFIGRFFGRHKMSPAISPNKTVEGAVGGVLCTVVLFPVTGAIFQSAVAAAQYEVSIHYPLLALMGLVCALAAVFGDLVGSVIKRECKIKDFGHVLPGHGGILDRFDSVLLVAPLFYLLVQVFNVVS